VQADQGDYPRPEAVEQYGEESPAAFMFWGAGLFVFPLMLLYTATNYSVFRGRIRPEADHYH
jgi:cytochrome d ubiquinol oxidase subunit II